MPSWWLSSCCCEQKEFQIDLAEKHAGVHLLDPPIEWHARADHHLSHLDDDSGPRPTNYQPNLSEAAELELKFWAAADPRPSTPRLASWAALPEERAPTESGSKPPASTSGSSQDRMTSFYLDYAAQMTMHERKHTGPSPAASDGAAILHPLRARDSAQFIMDDASSLSLGDLQHDGSSESYAPLTLRAQDLVSSGGASVPSSPLRGATSMDATTRLSVSAHAEQYEISMDFSADCSVGSEGVVKCVNDFAVNLLVAKRNKFMRVGDFTTNVDEKIWRLGRKGDERRFHKSQVIRADYDRAIQKLLDGPFTEQQFSLFQPDELAEFEPYTVVIHIADRQVPYILIFETEAQKNFFVTRFERMRN